MSRIRLSLDGAWEFVHDASGEKPLAALDGWRPITVPMPWQAQFDDLRTTSGVGWYRRLVTLDEQPPGAAILHFGAVDYHAAAWLNGEFVGEHEGGYLPFEFDVAALLRAGDNELVVRVIDPDEDSARWPAYPFAQIPHGKQSWYGPISGLWQSVWLELCSRPHLQRLRLTPDAASGVLAVTTELANVEGTCQMHVTVVDPAGVQVAEAMWDGNAGEVRLDPAALQLWSPETPHLYTVHAALIVGRLPVDKLHETCGFRTIEARDGRLFLNGQPLYLRGVLDQAYYPETIYTPPSLEFLEDQVYKAKALGLNCLRCHIKVEDPRYYAVADRLGILVWTEIPNWVHLTPQAAERAKQTFAGMVERDWNHPSIIAWTLVNEDWGTDLKHNPEHRRWLVDFYTEAKTIDPTRLIVDNSACFFNFHVASDVEDYHYYRAIPDHAAEWDDWVEEFAGRADWAWASDYAGRRRDDLPLLVSEFGNWGLPDPAQIAERGAEPWWFETGYNWGDGIVYPHAMAHRFAELKLDRIFGDLGSFTRSHQGHMAASLAFEIASMRRRTAIGGYVITEFTDVHWECNGLLDMARHVKHGLAETFTPLNQDRVVTIWPQRWSGQPGEALQVELHTFDAAGAGTEGMIRWSAGGAAGQVAAPGGVVSIPLPTATESRLVPLQASWHDTRGARLATSRVELACIALPAPSRPLFVPGDEALAAALRGLGYDVAEAGEIGARLMVARVYDASLRTAVQGGARALVIAGPDFAASEHSVTLPVGGIVPRAGTSWQGDWATSFSWLRKKGPFAHLPGGPILEMEYAELMPDAVLVGLPAWAFAEHSWSALALGWIHKTVSLVTHVPYGRGAVTVTTFMLEPETLAQNTAAQGLLAGLVELASA